MTSAFLALQLFLGLPKEKLNYVVVPFDQIFDALARDEADLGLIIHEGQLTYAGEGLALSADLGRWWFAETGGLPLPLGGNVVKKSLGAAGPGDRGAVGHSLREHQVRAGRRGSRGSSTRCRWGAVWTGRWRTSSIGMYVNELTLDYGERGKRARVREFLDRGYAAGLLPAPVALEFV